MLQNIANMQQQVQEAEVHVAALQAIVVLQLVTRMPVNDNKKSCAPRFHFRDDWDSQLRSMFPCNAITLYPSCIMMFADLSIVVSLDPLSIVL
jgi:hypothetical protein